MTFIQPKPYIDRLKLRHHAKGRERRRNLSKIILEGQTPFPKPVTYEDIDKAFFEWVDKKLDVVYNGKKLPTYKLFSNQKLSEYSQTWENLDETGNIIMNFKTITRENNPQYGESQGGNYNVPGNRDYPMFCVPVLQENGEEAYDLYTMKQPLSVNFLYNVSVICNKYEILNAFNELIQYEFSALECYIAPNDHPMPMILENINDESEYSIDDRKYYAQSYQIKLMAYIIRKEDFKVTKIPSRFTMKILLNNENKCKKEEYNEDWLKKRTKVVDDTQLPKLETFSAVDICDAPMDNGDVNPPQTPSIKIEDVPDCCITKDSPYTNKVLRLIADFPYCEEHIVTFTMDCTMEITKITTHNVHDFVIKINGFVEEFEDEVRLKPGDVIEINVSREDEYKDCDMIIMGYDPDAVIDTTYNPESELDAVTEEENIYVNKKNALS